MIRPVMSWGLAQGSPSGPAATDCGTVALDCVSTPGDAQPGAAAFKQWVGRGLNEDALLKSSGTPAMGACHTPFPRAGVAISDLGGADGRASGYSGRAKLPLAEIRSRRSQVCLSEDR